MPFVRQQILASQEYHNRYLCKCTKVTLVTLVPFCANFHESKCRSARYVFVCRRGARWIQNLLQAFATPELKYIIPYPKY